MSFNENTPIPGWKPMTEEEIDAIAEALQDPGGLHHGSLVHMAARLLATVCERGEVISEMRGQIVQLETMLTHLEELRSAELNARFGLP